LAAVAAIKPPLAVIVGYSRNRPLLAVYYALGCYRLSF
jgi:hypothetical protein